MRPRRTAVLRAAAGLALSLGIVAPAYRLRALTLDGAAAALVIGSCVFGRGGLRKSLALIAFFITSSVLSKLPTNQLPATSVPGGRLARSPRPRGRSHSRPSAQSDSAARRNLRQVVANGGIPAVAVALAGSNGAGRAGRAFGGSLAAATADTWATEIGTRWGGAPRLLWGLRPVEPGESGGVTLIGTAGGLAGAGLIAAVVAARSPARVLALATAGLGGMLVDSFLGATTQGRFWCAVCDASTERPQHECGRATSLVRGLGWLDNDLVNLVGSAAGAVLALVLSAGLGAKRSDRDGRYHGTID